MDPIRCVMLIFDAGRVRKAESSEATRAEGSLRDSTYLRKTDPATIGQAKRKSLPLIRKAVAIDDQATSYYVIWLMMDVVLRPPWCP